MAATAPPIRSVEPQRPSPAHEAQKRDRPVLLVVSALTLFALLIHGYHPYAEDGGLYLAGIKRVLHPDLFPYWSGFTTAHLRFSLFAPMVAWIVRVSHLGLMTVMLFLYVASIWATLWATWQIATRCYSRIEACYGGVVLMALLLSVPVAGTSLMLMDPYVSARSISTPCGLFALVATIDIARQIRRRERAEMRGICVCFGTLSLAVLVHPLMAAYALGCVLVLATALLMSRRSQWLVYGALGLMAIITAGLLIRFTPMPPSGYMEIARTRTYWILAYWHWYELAGLAAPLIALALIAFHRGNRFDNTVKSLARTGVVVSVLSIVVAMLFALPGTASYAVARLQPLRVFQTVYFITIIVVGARLGELVLRRRAWRWATMISAVGALTLFGQLDLFPSSNHLELPWVEPANGWEQAFLWIRSHTPKGAIIALDADYISARGEDAQNFRAIAERSAIPDYSKDGGIASIAPDLTADWKIGEAAQKGLNDATDAQRVSALRATGAEWLVLSSGAFTALPCDYANQAAKVCRISADNATSGESHPAASSNLNVARLTNQSTSRH